MQHKAPDTLVILIIAAVVCFSSSPLTFGQSQALNGQIEGTILDQNNAAVALAVVTATNRETGIARIVITDTSGVYRFPLLPLGTYRITAEVSGFKKSVREDVLLATGQNATVDLNLEPGEVLEVVTVSQNSSVADAGKTDLGRVMTTNEVHNLPLIQRAPYNFALLQSYVTGRPGRGLTVPSFNVNGYLRRVNYLLDGNTNTVYDRRSRFLFVSETAVNEIQLVTNGFAAEFGDTPGMIMNMVTPSGSNRLNGSASYRFRQPSFYSRPFFFPAAEVPDNRADIFTATIGGPIIKDRWHFFFAFESQYRDDKAVAGGLLTIRPMDRDALIAAGLSADIFPAAIPSRDRGFGYVFRTDIQINSNNHLSARFNQSDLRIENGIGGRFNTLEQSIDATNVDFAFAIQLASFTANNFNELRFAYGRRNNGRQRNEFSGTGPSIIIPRVANFGSPTNADDVTPPLKIGQLQDNVTRTSGTHIFKFGAGFSHHDYVERAARYSRYRFANITQYVAARNGAPQTYIDYTRIFGDPETNYKATYWNVFAQDDWKLTRRFKLNYGLRYDLYQIPKADPTSLFHLSQNFEVDKNDLSPRIGAVYALRQGSRPTVIRVGAGIYYEAPLLAIYRDVIRFNGNSQFFSLTFHPGEAGAPNFPNTISELPAGSVPPPQDIYTIAGDYDTMYAIHSMIQIEQAITEDLSFSAGYVHSAGRHLNVYRNINPIKPKRYLADGRPVFGRGRLDPRFGLIVIAESGGVSNYDALSLQLQQRLSRGLQFSIHYTLSKGINDAPDGDIEAIFLSDPTNRSFDKGYSSADQRHTFVASVVFQPEFRIENKTLHYVFNHNQFGIIATANSGARFNIFADSDLNHDDVLPIDDRPVGIERNSGRTPAQYNVDLRYSRFVVFSDRYRLELFGEFQNLFNTNSIVAFTNTNVETDPFTGELVGPLPDFRTLNQSISQDSRQFQLGLKFHF